MAWAVSIHVFDVGAGDSSLIDARDTAANLRATLLIDGGLTNQANIVHNRVSALVDQLDTILVSHYDIDHSNGVTSLLFADNMWHMCDLIADAAVPAVPPGNRPQIIARTAARAAAAALGAWGVNTNQANLPGNNAANGVNAHADDYTAATVGINQANLYNYAGATLIPPPITRSNAARSAAIATADSVAAGDTPAEVQAAALTGLFNVLKASLAQGAKFETGGFYQNTNIIDGGDTLAPTGYRNAVAGRVKIGAGFVQVPGLVRNRWSIPALGDEVLWPNLPLDPNAPVAIVVSTPMNWPGAPTGTGWQGPNAPVTFQGGTPGNCMSIGVVLLFGEFSYFTAGDLPLEGEDPIGDALVDYALPNGHGGTRPQPLTDVANLKCSHHGSHYSTSDEFVDTIDPAVAMFSCGFKNDHPTQAVIDAVLRTVDRFYLTNCSYPRLGVPFSNGLNQLLTPGNRSRVSGDNVVPNNAVGRNRGNIVVRVTQASAAAAIRQMGVLYWEQMAAVPGIQNNVVGW